MNKELRKYLEKMIEKEWHRYRMDVLKESSRKVEENDNIYVNYNDYDCLGEDIYFNNIFKFGNRLYGLYSNEFCDNKNDKNVYSIVEVNPMILLDDEYREDDNIDDLILQYQIKYSGYDIEVQTDIKYFSGEKYICYIKPVLIENNVEE